MEGGRERLCKQEIVRDMRSNSPTLQSRSFELLVESPLGSFIDYLWFAVPRSLGCLSHPKDSISSAKWGVHTVVIQMEELPTCPYLSL